MEDKRIKRQKVYKVIMLVVLTAVITCMTTTIFMYNKFKSIFITGSTNISTQYSASTESNIERTLNMFKSLINSKYIYDVDEEKLADGALKGYIEALEDPYTEYLTKEEMQDFTEEASSNYVGIGVYVYNYDNKIYIAGVIKNSPALEAGIQVGDILKKIDGIEYSGEQLEEATSVLKSEEGTKVKVTILRNEEEIELEVERRKITIEHVDSEMLDNNIAYIQVASFDSGVADSFEKQLNELLEQGANKIIIDLRQNGGGIVTEATDIADLFTDIGETLLITKGKNEDEKVF